MSKTTLDLSTLSDIAVGAHTVKVKAKADGYNDSEFSNEVSYTKTPPMYRYSVYNSSRSSVDIAVYKYVGSAAEALLSPGESYSGSLPTNKIRIWTRGNTPTITEHQNCTYEFITEDSELIVTADSPDKKVSIDVKA